MKRVIEQKRVFFKKVGDTYLTNDRPFSGDQYWEVIYTELGVVLITFWNKNSKHRSYIMENLPKAIKAWLAIQGIPLETGSHKL